MTTLPLVFALLAAAAGWVPEGPPKVFVATSLYDLINGGAEPFLELGFEQVSVQRLRRGDDKIDLEIYRMKDVAAAYGLYRMKCGQEKRDPGIRDRHTLTRHQLMLQRHRFFVLVHNLGGHKRLVPDMVRMGRQAAAKLPADEAPKVLGLLPAEGRVAGSERIIRGPSTLGLVATLGDGDILKLQGLTAIVATYRESPRGEHSLLLVPYPSPERARQALDHLVEHLDPYLSVLRRKEDRLVFRDHEDRFGEVVRSAAQMRIRLRLRKDPGASGAD